MTVLLDRARAGDENAEAAVLPLVYAELRAIARAKMQRVGSGHTLQATALVHEAYLRSLGAAEDFENRRHFFFVAAQAMRDILVDHARKKAAQKRGGDREHVRDGDFAELVAAPVEDMVALNDALVELEKTHPRSHQVVMLRFFAGLTTAEAAELLEVTERTAERDWKFAKTCLYAVLSRD